jgi:serine/threonine protein kinase
VKESQWRAVEASFDALHGLPEDQVAAGLAALDDEEVRVEVATLLRNARPGDTVAEAIHGMVSAVTPSQGAAAPTHAPVEFRERRIGPYRMVRRVGQGGQGAVFEAVRDDGTFHQRVAIKLVKWEMDGADARERFRRERQILAGLEHPYIARLLDGGETPEGTPYLVLEFVEGEPLTKAAAEWPLRRKLELFLKICQALSVAHRNLVIHRDLKPANILVTAAGDPKLLDFGIAKLVDGGSQNTQTGLAALTPQYASPEQVRGAAISTSTDIYSLGVVLYLLLTGRRPYTLDTATFAEMDRIICRQAPAHPGLGDELDDIILMALRKEPERRYGSVERFAEDIENYLNHRPVNARRDTVRYRARKFVRRNWWQVAAVATVIVSLSASLAVSLSAQQRANRRFNQVRQLANRFLFDFHDEIAKTPGTLKAREMVVSTALQYLNSLAKDAARDPGLQWELAVAYGKVAAAQGATEGPSLGRLRDALASYDKAFALARPLARQGLLTPTQREAFVNLLLNAQVLHFNLSEFDHAVRLGREAVDSSAGLRDLARRKALNQWSTALGRSGDLVGSLNARERTLPIMREEAKRDPSRSNRLALANTLSNLGYFKGQLTRFDEGRKDELEALTMLRVLEAERHGDAVSLRRIFTSLYFLGVLEGAGDRPSPGRTREAAARFQEAIDIMEPLIAADPHDNNSRNDTATAHLQIAYALWQEQPEEAIRHAAAAGRLFDVATPDATDERARSRIVAADAQRRLGQFGKAEELLREGEGILKTRDAAVAADLDLSWAQLLQARGAADAAPRFEKSIAILENLYAKTATPGNAWLLCRALDAAAAATPETAKSRRGRILAVWSDQVRRYPGQPYLERKAGDAQAALTAR